MKLRNKILILIFLLSGISATAQNPQRKEIDLDEYVLELFSQQDDSDIDYSDFYERLFQYYGNPIDLNNTDREELSSLFILSEQQINNLFLYIAENGNLLSLYELQAVPGFDIQTINKLLPFVDVFDSGINADNRPLYKRILTERNNYLLIRYNMVAEKKNGFIDSLTKPETRYLGNRGQSFIRFRTSHTKDFSIGFTLENDQGERLGFQNNQFLSDFSSFHIQLYNKKRFKTIAIGDFNMSFGQGLVIANPLAFGKGGETINTLRRSNIGFKPYTSVMETNFFRGVGITYKLGKFEISPFVSYKYIDGNVNVDTTNNDFDVDNSSVSYFMTMGFHRNLNELSSKKTVLQQVAGGNITYNSTNKNLQLGISAVYTQFNVALIRNPKEYSKFEFNGKSNFTMGTNYSYNWRNFNFFGEYAMSENKGYGYVNGLVSSLSPKVELAMLNRNFSKDFHTFYGNGFGENTRNINEKGTYIGIKIKPNRGWTIAAFYDRFTFPWMRSFTDAPSSGDEYLIRVTRNISKQISIYGQFRSKTRGKNLSNNITTMDQVVSSTKNYYLLNFDYRPKELIQFKTRVQASNYQQMLGKKTAGIAIAQDITLEKGKFKLSARYALFDTDDYDNRQYLFEKDVLYAFAFPAYFGKGTRYYVLINYNITRNLEIWARLGRYDYIDRTVVGSGTEQINAPHKTELKAQIKYVF